MRCHPYHKVLIATLAAVGLVTCSAKNPTRAPSPSGSATVSVSLVKTSLAESITAVSLAVFTGEEVIYTDTTGVERGEFLFAPFELPVGEAHFHVEALDGKGRSVYTGDKTVTIRPGEDNAVRMALSPSVPMVRLAPFYSATQVGAVFTSVLELHNIAAFVTGQFRVAYDPTLITFRGFALLADTAWGQINVIPSRTRRDTLVFSVMRFPAHNDDAVPVGLPALLGIEFRAVATGQTIIRPFVDNLADDNGLIDEWPDVVTDNQTIDIVPGTRASISGTVIDGQTADPVAGALVVLGGAVDDTVMTDSSGTYRFSELPTGDYTISVSRDGYIGASKNVTLIGEPVVADFALSRELGASEFRVILTWGASPSDLDAHYFTGDYHVYWIERGTLLQPPFAELDIDDRTGFGPETITIGRLIGPAIYAVHNFSGEFAADTDIKQSRAHVDVFRGDVRVAAFDVPAAGEGYLWRVFDLDSAGNVVPTNYLTNFPDSTGAISIERPPRTKVKL